MSLPDQSSQTDCQGGGIEFELKIPILVNLFKVVLPTSTHSVGTCQSTRAPHVIAFTRGDRVAIREGTSKSLTKCRIRRRPEQKAPQVRSHPAEDLRCRFDESRDGSAVPLPVLPQIWKSISIGEVHLMRADIVPGAVFPDYELPDQIGTMRKLSELQGSDPMILVLSRGGF